MDPPTGDRAVPGWSQWRLGDPWGKPTFLAVTNLDSTPEEFEMLQLAIEKVIPGGGKARIRIRPLGPGRYTFRGEFHQDTAQGVVVSE